MTAVRHRDATSTDYDALGVLHVASWRETYAGILPERLLDALSPVERAAMWRAVLREPGRITSVFVAERRGRIIGFAACGGQRDKALAAQGFDGQIGAIYVLRDSQRLGVGRALMKLLASRLTEQGRTAACLWVLRDNAAARRFYERLDGAVVAERQERQANVEFVELAYGWRHLARLTDTPVSRTPPAS